MEKESANNYGNKPIKRKKRLLKKSPAGEPLKKQINNKAHASQLSKTGIPRAADTFL